MAKRTGVKQQASWEERRRARETKWRGHLAAWQRSGLSQAAYCRQQNLIQADFSWWKHELLRRDGRRGIARGKKGKAACPQFVPLQVTAERMLGGWGGGGGCELELRNGYRLRIGSGVDPRWVAEMAAALEHATPC